MKQYYELQGENITGNNFKLLVEILTLESSYFTLTRNTADTSDIAKNELRKALNSFLIKEFETERWFCYLYLDSKCSELSPILTLGDWDECSARMSKHVEVENISLPL